MYQIFDSFCILLIDCSEASTEAFDIILHNNNYKVNLLLF